MTQDEFKGTVAAQIDQMLNLVYVLLFMALVIALFGIANTLALSVFERTREIGLLRAVGMSRAQVRSSVRWESVLIATARHGARHGHRPGLRLRDGAGAEGQGHRHADDPDDAARLRHRARRGRGGARRGAARPPGRPPGRPRLRSREAPTDEAPVEVPSTNWRGRCGPRPHRPRQFVICGGVSPRGARG